MATTIYDAHDCGNDVLLVTGTIDGLPEPAYGEGQELRPTEVPILDQDTHQPVVDDHGRVQTRWIDVAHQVRVLLPQEQWPLRQLTAQGHVSALMHHFDDNHFAGHPGEDVGGVGQPACACAGREMTPDEKLAYCKRLLEEQHAPAQPVSLGIRG